MINSNRLTIIVDDGAVYKDDYVYLSLDLSDCGIPEDVHALQWMIDSGHIEYRNAIKLNLKITELPDWAYKCVEKWDLAHQGNQQI